MKKSNGPRTSHGEHRRGKYVEKKNVIAFDTKTAT